ncbi:MAG: rod shape-determining protein MreC [Acidobacteria bacterium]|nr:rod shape-determining protein MreC [Acidobacteriota bacterium]
MGSTRRTFVLFLVLSFAHLLLMSVQMQSRSGVPLLQAGAFGVFAAIQRVMAGVSDTVRSGWSNYVALRGVVAENDALQKQVLSLEGQVQTQAAIVSQTRALEQLLNLQQSLVAQTLAARVIAGDPAPGAFVITIDRGSADGVEPNMAVLGHAGVIGRVINRPTVHAAQVQLLIGHNAGAGGVTEMSEAVGIIKGGAGVPPLEMAYVDLLKDVQVGERVLTSGLDGIFPRGFVIGTIERVVKGSGVYSEIAVRPAVDFSNISMVLVMLTRPTRAEGGS